MLNHRWEVQAPQAHTCMRVCKLAHMLKRMLCELHVFVNHAIFGGGARGMRRQRQHLIAGPGYLAFDVCPGIGVSRQRQHLIEGLAHLAFNVCRQRQDLIAWPGHLLVGAHRQHLGPCINSALHVLHAGKGSI